MYEPALVAFVAGLLAAAACGLGAIPAFLVRHASGTALGRAYAFAAGLMLAAAALALIGPGIHLASRGTSPLFGLASLVVGGMAGSLLLYGMQRVLPHDVEPTWSRRFGGRAGLLVFLVMTLHSIPEGIAVGVGYGAAEHAESLSGLGHLLAIAIAIHNVPEGLVVALPMRAGGAAWPTCFLAAFLTSLPQAIAAVPACLAVSVFDPLVLPSLGLAAGAMVHLVVAELLPEARTQCGPTDLVGWFAGGTIVAAPMLVL